MLPSSEQQKNNIKSNKYILWGKEKYLCNSVTFIGQRDEKQCFFFAWSLFGNLNILTAFLCWTDWRAAESKPEEILINHRRLAWSEDLIHIQITLLLTVLFLILAQDLFTVALRKNYVLIKKKQIEDMQNQKKSQKTLLKT